MATETKKCPFCGEEIRIEAKKCRFCGEWLSDKEPVDTAQSSAQAPESAETPAPSTSSPAPSPAPSQIIMQAPAPSAAPSPTAVFVQAPAQSPAQTPTQVIVNQETPKTNGIGVAGFIISLICAVLSWLPGVGVVLWFFGLLFSFIGMFKKPRGLAVAGFIVSIIDIVLILILVGGIIALLEAFDLYL